MAQTLGLKRYINLNGDLSKLKGVSAPLVWDNAALAEILERSLEIIEEYKSENKQLKDKILKIKEVLK
jgi:hypothetical protein